MSDPAKILWISCVAEKGGAEVYMLNLLRHLDRNQFAPAVALLRPGPLADELKGLQIPTYVLEQHRMRNVAAVGKSIGELKRIIQTDRFALVHSNGFRAHAYGGVAAWRASVPEVWSVFTVEKSGLSTTAILKIPTTQVTAICPRTADYFVERGLPTNMIWPGVDLEKLEHATKRDELVQRFGLPANGRWISMGARLQRYKGQEFFIRAIAALPASMNDVHGIIMGGALFGMEQTYLDELKQLAASLGVAARIHFTGFVSDADLYGLVSTSELLMHPALDEDFGLIVAEAQALGRPVLAYASVGPAAIVEHDVTGRLVAIGDQPGLNAALGSTLASREQLNVWGAAGRVRSRKLFGAATAAGHLERVYRACLSGR